MSESYKLRIYLDKVVRRSIIKEYIRNNPSCTYLDIRRDTKLKVERFFKNMPDAYNAAGVKLPKRLRKRGTEGQKSSVINFIRHNTACSVPEIQKSTGVNVIRTFGSILHAYRAADVKYPKREVTSGVANPFVVERCNEYEKRVVQLLSSLGDVKAKVRTTAGIVDCLFRYENKTYAVEIKDYRGANNITMHEIKQLIKYMQVLHCNNGLLICPKESFPKRKNGRNVYIGNLAIKILSEEDLRGT